MRGIIPECCLIGSGSPASPALPLRSTPNSKWISRIKIAQTVERDEHTKIDFQFESAIANTSTI